VAAEAKEREMRVAAEAKERAIRVAAEAKEKVEDSEMREVLETYEKDAKDVEVQQTGDIVGEIREAAKPTAPLDICDHPERYSAEQHKR